MTSAWTPHLDAILEALESHGVSTGDQLGLVAVPGVGVAVASTDAVFAVAESAGDWTEVVRRLEAVLAPRWVLWSQRQATPLARAGVRVARCWDIAAVHRLIYGGWAAEPEQAWAALHGLDPAGIPHTIDVDLFNQRDPNAPPAEAVRPDGYLDPDWVGDEWSSDLGHIGRWAQLAAQAAVLQQQAMGAAVEAEATTAAIAATIPGELSRRWSATARSESAAELLCAELSVDGLPMDREVAEQIVASFVGPRALDDRHGVELRAERDELVLRHAPDDMAQVDLRSPGQVKSLLRRVGIEVPDTRAWRLEALRESHAVVDALLVWRKAERVSTTFGYAWLDRYLGADGRLRGDWSASDGAAGRMTASAGLHNMPADMRPAVVAEPGHIFVRADLGQIEPRVLAAVSGDAALGRATVEADMYAPIAQRLGVDRATAKVAVLGAMYGQTTGHGAQALAGLRANYPVAMTYLEDADREGQVGHDVRTYGGRLVRMGSLNVSGVSDRDARSRSAGQGRYARNAMVQGAAAEFFKVWAVTVRARGAAIDAQVVLCLHDELLVHVPEESADDGVRLLEDCLQETVRRWAPDASVRFSADTSLIRRWSDAKD